MKRILITGSTGYIGKAFIRTFGPSYNLRLFGRTEMQGNYEFVQGDIKHLEDIIKASQGVDTILHLAAVSPHTKVTNNLDYFNTNTVGTLNVLEAAVKNNIKKIVYASSVCAVGFRGTLELIKETDFCRPSDGMYGYSKYLAEKLCEFYTEKNDINIICLRIAMVIPQHDLVIPTRFFMPYWLGAAHIEDVVQAIKLAIDNESIHYGVYHIASDSRYSKFDIKKAKKELNFKPKHDFKELIKPSFIFKIVTALIGLILCIKNIKGKK